MASPRRKDPGKQQSSTATGVNPPHLDIPIGDTTTTPNPSVTTTQNPSVTTAQNPSVTTTPNPSVATDGATRRQRVNFTDSIEYPQGKTILPRNFCSQCLTRHPFKTKERTYHIRSFKENLAMHEAIGLGKLPKVDPWAEVVKAFKPPSPKPAPAQTQRQEGLCTGTYRLSETDLDWWKDATKELDDPFAKVELLNTLLDREDRAIERMRSAMSAQQAPAAQPFGSYETAATTGGYNSHYPLPTQPRPRSPQPTGPPPKKKRRAGNHNEGSGRANKGARFGGAHTTTMQGAGNQRANAAQTTQPTTNPASNTDQRQRASSNPLESVQRTSQTKSLNDTDAPTTGAPTKTPAKGDAAAAKSAADDEATAQEAASTNDQST